MRNEILEELKVKIEERYGEDNDTGCFVNGHWLSSQTIIDLIEELDY